MTNEEWIRSHAGDLCAVREAMQALSQISLTPNPDANWLETVRTVRAILEQTYWVVPNGAKILEIVAAIEKAMLAVGAVANILEDAK